MDKAKVFVLLGVSALFFGVSMYFFMETQSLKEDNDMLRSSNQNLKNEIDEITANTTDSINKYQTFYEKFFEQKNQKEILLLFGLVEYTLPDNNFITAMDFQKKPKSISMEFKAPEIKSLVQLDYNLEKMLKLGVIQKYKLTDITLEQKEGLNSGEFKKYALTINFGPNNDDNDKIQQFLIDVSKDDTSDKSKDFNYARFLQRYFPEIDYDAFIESQQEQPVDEVEEDELDDSAVVVNEETQETE